MDGVTTTQATDQTVQNDQATAAVSQVQQPEGADTPEKMNAFQKLIAGLLGEKGTGDAVAQDSDKGSAGSGTGEKAFTQTDVDAAVEAARQAWQDEQAEAERMKKLSPEERAAEEQKKKDARIADLESRLLQKELRETASRELEKEGIPAGFADVLDYSSRERMEETLQNTTRIFKDSLAAAVMARLKGKTPEGLGGAAAGENLIRDQIARNIRGL